MYENLKHTTTKKKTFYIILKINQEIKFEIQ
jgi:hypothetical protein